MIPVLEFSVAHGKWVALALSTDTHRPVLRMAAIGHYNGCAVLVATDTYRLHLLVLAEDVKPFETKIFDLRRVLYEADYERTTDRVIIRDLSAVELRSGEPVHAPVWPDYGKYPNFAKVIPEKRRPVAEFFAINSQFLADATHLSREDARKTLIYSDGYGRPIVFQGPESNWLAIVMPMELPRFVANWGAGEPGGESE